MIGRSTSSLLDCPHARRSRALAYLLLILIGFSSTVGVTHHHGRTNLSPPTTSSTIHSPLAEVSIPSSTTRDPVKSGDCLVCQFQQTLSNAEIFTPEVLPAPTGSAPVFRVLAVAFHSKTRSTGQGRAPPVTC